MALRLLNVPPIAEEHMCSQFYRTTSWLDVLLIIVSWRDNRDVRVPHLITYLAKSCEFEIEGICLLAHALVVDTSFIEFISYKLQFVFTLFGSFH